MKAIQILIFLGFFSLTTALLTGCSDPSTTEITNKFSIPEGLQDCKIYRLSKGSGIGYIDVIRCPNSNTTTNYSSGKSNQSVTVLEEQLKAAKLKESALQKLTPEEKQALGLSGKE